MALRNENGKLTVQGNKDIRNMHCELAPIFEKYREAGYSKEEVFYMISSLANQFIMEEALTGHVSKPKLEEETPADRYLAEKQAEDIDLIELFFKLRDNVVYPYFDGFEDGYVVYALEDYRNYYWHLPYGEGCEGEVHYAETVKDLFDKDAGHYYVNDIYTQRFYDKWVWRGEKYTMIFCDTHTDGNKFFGVYSNDKEIKE